MEINYCALHKTLIERAIYYFDKAEREDYEFDSREEKIGESLQRVSMELYDSEGLLQESAGFGVCFTHGLENVLGPTFDYSIDLLEEFTHNRIGDLLKVAEFFEEDLENYKIK